MLERDLENLYVHGPQASWQPAAGAGRGADAESAAELILDEDADDILRTSENRRRNDV